jgi:hypothetical protein
MRIAALSLNTESTKESPNVPFPEDWIVDPPYDLYAEFTQEDARKPGGSPLVQLSPSFLNVASASLNPSSSKQNVMLSLWSSQTPLKVEKGSIPVQTKDSVKGSLVLAGQSLLSAFRSGLGYSKGAVWIQIAYPGIQFLFINLHLPVKTGKKADGSLKDPSLGFAYRKEVLGNVLNQLKPRIQSNTHILIGGDLNFRMTDTGMDQLTELLKEGSLPVPLQELMPPAGQSPTWTCKFQPIDPSNTNKQSCRLTPLPPSNTFPQVSHNVQGRCGNASRTPSRCDRFLVKTESPVSVALYDTEVLIPESDHNALFVIVDFPATAGGGQAGRRHLRKTQRVRKHRKSTRRQVRRGRRA